MIFDFLSSKLYNWWILYRWLRSRAMVDSWTPLWISSSCQDSTWRGSLTGIQASTHSCTVSMMLTHVWGEPSGTRWDCVTCLADLLCLPSLETPLFFPARDKGVFYVGPAIVFECLLVKLSFYPYILLSSVFHSNKWSCSIYTCTNYFWRHWFEFQQNSRWNKSNFWYK